MTVSEFNKWLKTTKETPKQAVLLKVGRAGRTDEQLLMDFACNPEVERQFCDAIGVSTKKATSYRSVLFHAALIAIWILICTVLPKLFRLR
jgi:hypothetical protein